MSKLASLWLALTLAISIPPLDPYLDGDMTRLMLIQVPTLILLGVLLGPLMGVKFPMGQNFAFAGLILGLGLVMFWMIPRSLDLAVVDSRIDALMHLTLLAAGLMLRLSLPCLPLLIQMAAGIYATAMAASLGVILNQTKERICATFTLEQQQAAGSAILWACGLLLSIHLVWSLSRLVQTGTMDE